MIILGAETGSLAPNRAAGVGMSFRWRFSEDRAFRMLRFCIFTS